MGERSHWLPRCLPRLQNILRLSGRYDEALAVSSRELLLLRDLGATGSASQTGALRNRAIILQEAQRFDEARQYLIEALSRGGANADRFATQIALAELEFNMGDVGHAAALVEHARKEYRASETGAPDRDLLAVSLNNTTAYRLILGELDAAKSSVLEALETLRGAPMPETFTWAVQHVATIAALRGDPIRAARLKGYVDRSYATQNERRQPTEEQLYRVLVSALEGRLNEREIARFSAEGAALGEDQARDLALVTGGAL